MIALLLLACAGNADTDSDTDGDSDGNTLSGTLVDAYGLAYDAVRVVHVPSSDGGPTTYVDYTDADSAVFYVTVPQDPVADTDVELQEDALYLRATDELEVDGGTLHFAFVESVEPGARITGRFDMNMSDDAGHAWNVEGTFDAVLEDVDP